MCVCVCVCDVSIATAIVVIFQFLVLTLLPPAQTKLLLCFQCAYRPAADQFSAAPYFDSLPYMALKFLTNLFQKVCALLI